MYIDKPQSIRRMELEIAARVDVMEVTAHPNEDGNTDRWMLFVHLCTDQEICCYISAKQAEAQNYRHDLINWILTQEQV